MAFRVALELGLRYAFFKGSTTAFVGKVAMFGLGLSVAVLVIVVSVINGFERELQNRVLQVLPHVTLQARQPEPFTPEAIDSISKLPQVAGVASIVQGAGMVHVPNKVSGLQLTGIDPQRYPEASAIGDFVEAGALSALHPGSFNLILGKAVATDIGVVVGDHVTMVLPQATVTIAGVFARQKRLKLVGILNSQSELDGRAGYLHIRDAQRLFRLGDRIHGYQIRGTDIFAADEIGLQAQRVLGSARFRVQSWTRTHGNLFTAIATQKATMFVLLSFLVGVAAFNLVSTLVMVIRQRSGDVAILRTLGGQTGLFVWSFMIYGVLLGALGILGGMTVGVVIAKLLPPFYEWVSQSLHLNLMSQYFVNYLPVDVRSNDLLRIGTIAFALATLSTLYPVWQVTRLRPSTVLANE